MSLLISRPISAAARAGMITLMAFLSATTQAVDKTIDGNPLRISSNETLAMTVFRNQGTSYVQQYYSTYETTIRLAVGAVCGNHNTATGCSFVPVIGGHTQPDPYSIRSEVTTGDNVSIVHTVNYTQGEEIYRHQWVVTNNGQTFYSNVALRYGGDTFFAGNDRASGYYDANLGMVFCKNPNVSGLMGMFGGPTSPANGYYEDLYSLILFNNSTSPDTGAMLIDGDFPNTVNAADTDNGMALEWRQPSLAPTNSFTVIAYEKWTASGAVQVLAPAPSNQAAGSTFTLTYTVQNLQAIADTIDLVATGPVGWTVLASPTFLTVAAQSAATVNVQVTIPANATTSGQVELQLTSRSLQTTHSDRTTITVSTPTAPVVTVQSPSIQLSRGDQTIYTPISPSTTEGITSILSALAGQSNTMTRAFAFDSYMGAYVELPLAAPMGGVLRTTGIFLATRQELNYSLSGTPATMPTDITVITGSQNGQGTLNTGWAFAGVPPVEISPGQYQTSFGWNDTAASAILQVRYQGTVVADTANLAANIPSLADLMGTINSGDSTTSRPWWWNGSAYVQVPTLKCGEAYWFKNNSLNSDITIQVVSSNAVNALAAVRGGSEATPAVPKPIRLHDQGAPPPPPSANTTTASSSSKGGCGTGSGIASLALLMFMVSLRFLILARR